MTNWNDIGNGLFELGGAYFTWRNYFQLRKDRELKGIWWPLIAFMTTWGFWNLLYYPSLGQWCSFAGGIALVSGNAFWVYLALKIKYFPPKLIEDHKLIFSNNTWGWTKDADSDARAVPARDLHSTRKR